MQLCCLALMTLHWYACATWLQSRLLAEGGRLSWVATVMNGSFEETTEAWPWPLWARYASSFARALNAVVGGEKVGGTHEEVTHAGKSPKILTLTSGCGSSNPDSSSNPKPNPSQVVMALFGRARLHSSNHRDHYRITPARPTL